MRDLLNRSGGPTRGPTGHEATTNQGIPKMDLWEDAKDTRPQEEVKEILTLARSMKP